MIGIKDGEPEKRIVRVNIEFIGSIISLIGIILGVIGIILLLLNLF